MNKRWKMFFVILFIVSCYGLGYQLGRQHILEPNIDHDQIKLESELFGAIKMMRLIRNDFFPNGILFDTSNVSLVLYTDSLIKQLEIMEENK